MVESAASGCKSTLPVTTAFRRGDVKSNYVEFASCVRQWKSHFEGLMSIAPSQVRYASLAALRKSIGIILTTLLLIPPSSVINRIFSATWYVNWRLMVTVSAILPFLVFTFFFVTELLEFATEEARERQLRFVFPGAMWLRGIYLGAILMGFTAMAGEYKEGDPWAIVVLPLVIVFLGFFAWPRALCGGRRNQVKCAVFSHDTVPVLSGVKAHGAAL
jgi:hypothetical protein